MFYITINSIERVLYVGHIKIETDSVIYAPLWRIDQFLG